MGGALVSAAVVEALGVQRQALRVACRDTGDLGDAAQLVRACVNCFWQMSERASESE